MSTNTEFVLGPSDSENITLMYLAFPFGFTGSPDIFGRVIKAGGRYRQKRRPTNTVQNVAESFNIEIFGDDGMFPEPTLGNRDTQIVGCFEEGDRLMLVVAEIRKKKLAPEWQWSTNLLLIGYRVGLYLDTIDVPGPKLIGNFNLAHLTGFDDGKCRPQYTPYRSYAAARTAGYQKVESGAG